MRRRYSVAVYIIIALFAIGVLRSLFRNPGQFLLPVILFAIIFLLYKFPPARLRQFFNQSRYSPPKPRKPGTGTGTNARSTARRKTNFKVIRGNKTDSSDDEPPRYH